MISSIITIGDKITLTKLYNSDENNSDRLPYVSSVLDINESEYIHIGLPMENGHMVALQIGENYKICFYTKRGLFQCDALVIDRYKEGPLHIATLQVLSNLVRHQRRQFYRLEKIMDIMHCLYQEDKSSDEQTEYQWKKAIMTDISGGGARFNSGSHYNTKDRVFLKVIIPLQSGSQELILKARVIASQMLSNQLGVYENRVEFSEIELAQREAIIRFVFEEERKQRRREKGLV